MINKFQYHYYISRDKIFNYSLVEVKLMQDYFDSEPVWVAQVINRLETAGYTVTCKYDGDGDHWQNKKYTVTKGINTYLLDGRAQELMRIAIN